MMRGRSIVFILHFYVLCIFIVTLQKWVLKENFLFVLVRNNHQPKQNKFATLPALDHEIGTNN